MSSTRRLVPVACLVLFVFFILLVAGWVVVHPWDLVYSLVWTAVLFGVGAMLSIVAILGDRLTNWWFGYFAGLGVSLCVMSGCLTLKNLLQQVGPKQTQPEPQSRILSKRDPDGVTREDEEEQSESGSSFLACRRNAVETTDRDNEESPLWTHYKPYHPRRLGVLS